jgi:DNA polymerase-3 subunit epsilon
LDLETTGLRPDRDQIVSIGAVPIDQARILLGQATYQVVRPAATVSAAVSRVHGLRSADLSSGLTLAAAVERLLPTLGDRIPVAHSGWVERAFLEPELRRQGHTFKGPFLDTAALALELVPNRHPEAGDLDLEGLAADLNVPVSGRHHALGDAVTAAGVFLGLANRLERTRPELTVRQLVELTRRSGRD